MQKNRFLPALLKTALLAAAGYAGVSALAAYRLARPKRRFAYGVSPTLYGLEALDVFFPARGGDVQISGWYIPNPASQRAVVLVHGKDVSRAIELFGRFLELARALYQAGFTVLMIDLRGHGLSGPGVYSFGLNERRDVLGAVDWLLAQGFRPGRIGLLGVSLGSSACLGAAAEEPAIGATVSDSGFAEIQPLIRANWRAEAHLPDIFLPGVLRAAQVINGYNLAASRPVDEVNCIRGALLLIHGLEDRMIPRDHFERLRAAAPRAETWLVPGAIHAGCFGANPAEYIRRVAGFFEANL